jgi:hypothetical protein
MKNLKKLSREQLKAVSGGGDSGCHCHGCSPSPGLPTGLPPADFEADGATQCWAKCDSYRQLCGSISDVN